MDTKSEALDATPSPTVIWSALPKQPKQTRCRQNLAHPKTRRTFYWITEAAGPICQECINVRNTRIALAEQESGNSGNPNGDGKAGKRSHSIKAPVVIGAVLAKRANGENKRQIARELQMSPNTVNKILDESEFDAALAEGKRRCIGLIPKAVQAVDTQLMKGDGTLGLKLLSDVGVLGDKALTPRGAALNAVFADCQVLIKQAEQQLPSAAEPIPVEASKTDGNT